MNRAAAQISALTVIEAVDKFTDGMGMESSNELLPPFRPEIHGLQINHALERTAVRRLDLDVAGFMDMIGQSESALFAVTWSGR